MDNVIQNIVYEFILPYALDLKDNFQKWEESYIVVIDNLPVQIRTERLFNKSDDYIIANCKIDNDRLWLISKTKVQIWFDEKAINSWLLNKELLLLWTNEWLIFWLKYLNKFLKDYKVCTEDYWLFPIKKEYILKYIFYTLNNKSELINNSNHILPFQIWNFNWDNEIFIWEEIDIFFRKMLVDNNSYNLQKELVLEIYNNYDLENYNLVIIQNSILFESFVYGFLNRLQISNGKIDKMKKKEQCWCIVWIYEVCTSWFNSLWFKFQNTNEFINFYENVLKVRNKLVHWKKLDNVTKEEAKNSIEYTRLAINYISNNFKINHT